MNLSKYGPWALIVGASEGIGAEAARQLAAAGINLILVSRSESKLEALAASIDGVQVRLLPLDVSRPDALSTIQRQTDDIDVGLLFYNVGSTFGAGRFLRSELADLERTMQLNSISQVALVHHFGRKMLERKSGGIVLIGSMAGNAGGTSTVLYGAGKAFAQNLAEGLWSEVKDKGIDILYVVVGAVNTPKRISLNIDDAPEQIVADPADVAREALAALPDGPVFVPAHLREDFQYFCAAPRREAAEAMTAMLKGFNARPGQ